MRHLCRFGTTQKIMLLARGMIYSPTFGAPITPPRCTHRVAPRQLGTGWTAITLPSVTPPANDHLFAATRTIKTTRRIVYKSSIKPTLDDQSKFEISCALQRPSLDGMRYGLM